jgi:hypothetical protein
MTGKDARTPARQPPSNPVDSRAERLAAALRANLHRRKAQGRARAGAADAPPEAAATNPGLDFAPKPGDKDSEADTERR